MPKSTNSPSLILLSLLEEHHLSSLELSKGIYLNHFSVKKIITGKLRITVPTAFKLAKFFGQPPIFWLDYQMQADIREAVKDKELQYVLKSISKIKKPKAPKKLGKKSVLSKKKKKVTTQKNISRNYKAETGTEIIISNSAISELKEIKELEQKIAKLENTLLEILEKNEQLKIDLSILKREYNIKVGRLYLRLDELEIAIVMYKTIDERIKKGEGYDYARSQAEEEIKEQKEKVNKERRNINGEEKSKSAKNISDEEKKQLKELFRKLSLRFHPDLENGNEKIMEKINKAYAENDLNTLQNIFVLENVEFVNTIHSIEALKEKIQKIEEAIKKATYDYSILQTSEWGVLKQNIEDASKKSRGLLSELSEKILNDIALKEMELKKLEKKHGK